MNTTFNHNPAAADIEGLAGQTVSNRNATQAPNGPFGYARDFLDNRFVYLTISPRAHGLSIGVNLNPDRKCNFDCIYCEVDRRRSGLQDPDLNCDVAGTELERTLTLVHGPGLKQRVPYANLSSELLRLRHVALSGDGEPTASPQFLNAVETVVHIRARGLFPFFKIVLITNASHLDRPEVQEGLSLFTKQDEIWAKLEAGTQDYMDFINRPSVSLKTILSNILLTAKERPVIIQSLFTQVGERVPGPTEIEQYALRLRELKEAGARIPLVQIYSATRPSFSSTVQHLPLRMMSQIAETVRRIAGLPTEVF